MKATLKLIMEMTTLNGKKLATTQDLQIYLGHNLVDFIQLSNSAFVIIFLIVFIFLKGNEESESILISILAMNNTMFQ